MHPVGTRKESKDGDHDITTMSVFSLQSDMENFKTLHLSDVLRSDQAMGLDYRAFTDAEPISASWVPREVEYFEDSERAPPGADCCDADLETDRSSRKEEEGDFPHLWSGSCPVLTARSLAALRRLIGPYVEFLPFVSSKGEFTGFKVLCFIDALDKDKSDIEWFHSTTKRPPGAARMARRIKRYEFIEERIRGAVIFRIPELPVHDNLFVTDCFVNCVNQAALKGFRFQQLWPDVEPAKMRQSFLERRRRKGRP